MKLRVVLVFCIGGALCNAIFAQQQMASSSAPASAPTPKPQTQSAKADPPAWSPLDGFNAALPKWIRFSGQFRTRVEGYTDGGFNPANEDAYLLTRLWLNVRVQPAPWLKFFAQSMDS